MPDSGYKPRSSSDFFSLVSGDALGQWLCNIAIQKPVIAILVAVLVGTLAPLIAWWEGNFVNPALSLDAYHDLGWWNQFLLAFPALLYLAGAYFGSIPGTLRGLQEAGVILATKSEWDDLRAFTRVRLNSLFYRSLPYLCGGFAAVTTLTFLITPLTWYQVGQNIAGWLMPLQVFLLYYLMTYLTLRLVIVYLVMQRLFGYKVNIQPFHDDGCGGLRSLAVLSLKLDLVMFVFGVIAAGGIYVNTAIYGTDALSILNLLMVVSYTFLAMLAFFMPLYATSERMREAKSKLNGVIADRMQNLNAQTAASGNREEDLEALRDLQAKVKAMQVWPFNLSAMLRFALAIAAPFVVLLTLILTAAP